MKRTGPTNIYVKELIEKLKKKSLELNAPIWKAVAEKLERPRRKKIEVNLGKIDKYTKAGDTVIVPGVVLGNGNLTKQIRIAALRFSSSAEKKIRESKSEILSIERLLEENPRGSGVKILG
jgi:large subunit ribosomal protein L18e